MATPTHTPQLHTSNNSPWTFLNDSPSFPTSVSISSSFPSTPDTPSDGGSLNEGIGRETMVRGQSIPIFLAMGEKVLKLGNESEDQIESLSSQGESLGLGVGINQGAWKKIYQHANKYGF
jgi:hypothetical protein